MTRTRRVKGTSRDRWSICRSRHGFKPRVEALETRFTPATHTWTGGTGAGALTRANAANRDGGVPATGETGGTLLGSRRWPRTVVCE
jgi:hypothetical protein